MLVTHIYEHLLVSFIFLLELLDPSLKPLDFLAA